MLTRRSLLQSAGGIAATGLLSSPAILRAQSWFRAYPFTVLQETDDLLVSGLCGKIWTLARDYPRLADADAFANWDERGTVRVAFAHWTRERDDGTAELCSEARVHAVDTTARLRLKAIWTVLGPFERLVGAEPLELAVSRATGAT